MPLDHSASVTHACYLFRPAGAQNNKEDVERYLMSAAGQQARDLPMLRAGPVEQEGQPDRKRSTTDGPQGNSALINIRIGRRHPC